MTRRCLRSPPSRPGGNRLALNATLTLVRSSSRPTRAETTAYRSHVRKQQLQKQQLQKQQLQGVADKLNLTIRVSHFPPGTSKWNKVEHRLFSFISINWRGRPLRTYETIISLIGNTTNRGGLVVRARLDRRKYPTGKKVSAKELRELKIERDDFHGDWNYVITPRTERR